MSVWRLRTSYVTALIAVGLGGVAGGCGLVVGASEYVVGDAGSRADDATTSVDGAGSEVDGNREAGAVGTIDAEGMDDVLAMTYASGGLEGGLPEAETSETGPGEGGPGDASTPFLSCGPDGGAVPQVFPAGSAELQAA